MPSSQPRIDVHALGVVGVVHRVGERHARDVALLDLRRVDEAELRELVLGQLDELVVVHLPQVVALEAEVLQADARLRLVRDHPRAPGAEVLDPADAHARVVDVDPVVREQVLAVDDQRDGEEVAVAQALRGGLDLAGGGGAGHADGRAQRQRGDHVAGLDPLAAGLDRDDPAVADLELRRPAC